MEQSTSLGPRPRLLLHGGARSFRLSPFEAILLLVILGVCGYIGYSAYARSTDLNSVPPAASTYLPSFRSTLTSAVSATGTVAATQQVTLTFGSAGKIQQLFAKLGDQVKQGQPLAKLDDAELQQSYRSAQANLASTQARLDAARAGPTDSDIATAQQSLATARSQVAAAQNNLADTLAKPTSADTAAAAQAVLTSQNAVQTAQDNKTKADNDVKTAQTALDTAKNNLADAQDDLDKARAAARTALASLRVVWYDLDQAVTDCKKSPSATPDLPDPDESETALTMLPLSASFYCTGEPNPNATPPATPIPSPKRAALAAAVTAYNSQANSYNTAVAGIKTKQNAVTTAQNAVTTATTALTTAQNKQTDGSLDRAIQNAQIGVTSAMQKQADTQAGAKPSEIDAARRSVDSAQAGLTSAQARYDDLFKPPANDVLLPLQATVEQALASVETAKKNLDAATITAPFDGQLSQVTGDVGTSVTAATGVFILLNPRLIRVDANVDQADISNLRAGQTATITFDALSGRSYQGTVTAIGLTPTIQQGVVTYVVTLGIDTSRLTAETPVPTPGMTGSISVTTSRTENALVVPSRAIRRTGRTAMVTVKTAGGGEEQRTITTGATNGTLVQVLTGLQEGEEVLISAATTAARTTTGTGTGQFQIGGGTGGGTGGTNPFAPTAPGR